MIAKSSKTVAVRQNQLQLKVAKLVIKLKPAKQKLKFVKLQLKVTRLLLKTKSSELMKNITAQVAKLKSGRKITKSS